MLEQWSDFYVATAGAAGALAGLIIVAMTVNIAEIIAIPSMPSRAASTIGSLVLIVVTAAAGLIPEQPLWLFGLVVLLFSLAALGLGIDSGVRMLRTVEPRSPGPAWAKFAIAVLQILPFTAGALLLLGGAAIGAHVLAAGILLVFIGSVANAWVLLVEIRR